MDESPEVETPEGVLRSFLERWQDQGLRAIAILAPEIQSPDERRTLIVVPAMYRKASDFLAKSDAFGPSWRVDDYANVAWTDITRGDAWLTHWEEHGIHSVVRVSFTLPAEKNIEFYGGCNRPVDRNFVSSFAADLVSSAPRLRNKVLRPLSGITPQQLRVLQLSMQGHSAKDCANMMGVTERTVNHHLAAIQAKLGTQNKIESITKSIWMGAL